MFQRIFAFARAIAQRGSTLFLVAILSFGLIISTPQVSQAGIFRDLLRVLPSGIQAIQLSRLSDRQEVALGGQINQQISRSVRINRDRRLNSFVQGVGRRLVPTSARSNIPYTFQVVDDDSVNAFATMGGYVYVHTGLLRAADNEAEVASVMAHEIGHIVGKHAIRQMRQRAISQGLLSAAGLDDAAAVQIGVDLALNRPNSREDESEADGFGLNNLNASGYAPEAMVAFMRKLERQGGGRVPNFLRTHPAASARATTLQAAIPNLPNRGQDGLDRNAYQQQVRSRL